MLHPERRRPAESWADQLPSLTPLPPVSSPLTPRRPPPPAANGLPGGAEFRLVRSKPVAPAAGQSGVLLNSAVVDLRPQRVVHVTTGCSRGVGGRPCGATHCALSAPLPLEAGGSPYSSPSLNSPVSPVDSGRFSADSSRPPTSTTLHTLTYDSRADVEFENFLLSAPPPSIRRRLSLDVSSLDAVLADVDIMFENKTTTEWRSSFQNIRGKFGENSNKPSDTASSSLPRQTQSSNALRNLTSANTSAIPYATLPRRRLSVEGNGGHQIPPIPSFDFSSASLDRRRKSSSNEPAVELASFWTDSVEGPKDRIEPVLSAGAPWTKFIDESAAAVRPNRSSSSGSERVNEIRGKSVENDLGSPISSKSGRNGGEMTLSSSVGENKTPVVNYSQDRAGSHGQNSLIELVLPNRKKSPPKTGLNFAGANGFAPAAQADTLSPNSAPAKAFVPAAAAHQPTVAEAVPRAKQPPVADINFSALDSLLMGDDSSQQNKPQQHTTVPKASSKEARLINDLTQMVGRVSEAVEQRFNKPKSAGGSPTTNRSPSPDRLSTTSSVASDSAPSGLPHPQPKHHLREQLLSAGLEPRSPTMKIRPSPVVVVPRTGAVAAKVRQLERSPFAAADEQAPWAHLQLMQPTVFRVKPVIHLNQSRPADRPQAQVCDAVEPPKSSGISLEATEQAAEQKTTMAPPRGSGELAQTTAISSSSSVALETQLLQELSTPQQQHQRLTTAGQQQQLQVQGGTPSTPSTPAVTPITALCMDMEKKWTLAEPTKTKNVSAAAALKQLRFPHPPQPRPAATVAATAPKADVPRFYVPYGAPIASSSNSALLNEAAALFSQQSDGVLPEDSLPDLMTACGLPIYLKKAVVQSCCPKDARRFTFQEFSKWWNAMSKYASDDAARLFYALIGEKRKYLLRDDLKPIVQDIIDTFPGLYFLREAPEFHSRYLQTVIERIFYTVNRSWSGKISLNELRRSNFIQALRQLDDAEDINSVTDYFSYEHFYVVYCKFWELDSDHDLVIDCSDLAHYGNSGLTPRVIERIFSSAVNNGARRDYMHYSDFVRFILAEEDKRHPTSIEYWFRCLDMNGDGVLSVYELEHFYEDIERKMQALGVESMQFGDVLCQMLDMVRPRNDGFVSLGDLKRSRMSTRFFNAFTNVQKYYEQEINESDQRAAIKSETGEELSDWERFCAEEYELLMQEEQANQLDDNEILVDSDPDEAVETVRTAGITTSVKSRSGLLDTL